MNDQEASVPFFDMANIASKVKSQFQSALPSILSGTTIVNGSEVRSFEKRVADYTGAANAIAVNSATDALIILLEAFGIGAGDEVIVPAYSFFATVSCVVHVGAIPVFVDIDEQGFAMNPKKVEAAITPKTKVVMPVHLFHQLADVNSILKICRENNLLMLEDSAEAIGMRHSGVHGGLFGDGGVLSFFPTKTLGAMGDAGMILLPAQRDDIARECRALRNQGRLNSETAETIGYTSRLDDVQAAFLNARLAFLDGEISRRQTIAKLYSERLAVLGEKVQVPVVAPYNDKNDLIYYVYLLEAEGRDDLVTTLEREGVVTEVYYPMPLHLQPCCKQYGAKPGDMPVAEKKSSVAIGLPMFPDMTDDQVNKVCDIIISHYSTGNG